MPVIIDWRQVALRLALTVFAGLVIGFNRGEHGRPAGIRTTLLVCLAASLSMIQANFLLNTVGKSQESFAQFDVMRLPLGVLSGMGFIGAGAILRKGNLVRGLTTAATLWFVTLMGLCFGGGQIGLGLAALVLGSIILWGLKYLEGFIRQDMRGLLTLTTVGGGLPEDELRMRIEREGCAIVAWGVSLARGPERREIRCEIQWRPKARDTRPPPVVATLCADPAVSALRWEPQGLFDESGPQQSEPKGTPVAISA
jgi:putative Mg2+ transporter-C (MgtC) family protein